MQNITQPLRLAVGSHQAGSGKGCAMNVISWENGDKRITDYPSCSALPLARIVQVVNDTICTHRDGDLLCAPCSLIVLELGHATVGTADSTREQEAAWLAEMLDSPEWGVIRFITGSTTLVRAVASLYRRRADGDEPGVSECAAAVSTAYAADAAADAAAYAANAVAAATDANAVAAATYAVYATRAVAAATDAATHADAAPVTYARAAIAAWHRICGTSPTATEPQRTANAVARMLATA